LDYLYLWRIKELLVKGLLEKLKLAQNAYEEDHKICWKEATVLQSTPKSTYRKCKEAPHVVLVDHPIRQPSLDISPTWASNIAAEVSKLQLCPVQAIVRIVFLVLIPYRKFVFLVRTLVLTVL
jgi:hypothetical protein